MENILNVAEFSPEEQSAKIKSAVAELKKGAQVTIQSTTPFEKTMKTILNEYASQIEWQPLMVTDQEWIGTFTGSTTPPQSIFDLLERHHRHCDSLFIQAENALNSGDEANGIPLMQYFLWNMELHFRREEKILFVKFENQTGMTQGGPTFVMREEHQQIRAMLTEIGDSLRTKDYSRISDLAETMLILVQQHNQKEEAIMYPMADQHLVGMTEKLIKKMTLLTIE